MATIHRLNLNEVEAINRYRDIIEEELGQDVIDYGDEPGLRALHVVARTGEIELARALIRKRANVNFCTTKGLSPLHYAVLSGKPDMIRLLLLYGARVNTRSQRDGKTPLFSAAQKGDLEIVKLLLENGANHKLSDNNDMLPAEIAACHGHMEIKELLDRHAREDGSSSADPITPNPIFELMSHRRRDRQRQVASAPTVADLASPISPLSSLSVAPSTFMSALPSGAHAESGSMADTSPSPVSAYQEPPPSYEEVMSADSLFGCTAYSQSTEDSDTTALLGSD